MFTLLLKIVLAWLFLAALLLAAWIVAMDKREYELEVDDTADMVDLVADPGPKPGCACPSCDNARAAVPS
jgi:hypothetical protein